MKKLLLSALAVCAFTFSNAQETETTESNGGFAKGDMMISGAFSIGSMSNIDGDKDDSSSDFSFSPKFGYFVTDNIAAGVKLEYGVEKAEYAGNDYKDMQNLSAGVFGRYYMTPASKFSVFAELGFDYVSSENKLSGVVNGKNSGFDIGAGVGVSYFISNSFALEANWGMLGYETMKNEADGAESENKFGLGLDTRDLAIGLVYKF